MADQPKKVTQTSAPVSEAVRREAEKILAAKRDAAKKRNKLILKIVIAAVAVAVIAVVAVVLSKTVFADMIAYNKRLHAEEAAKRDS